MDMSLVSGGFSAVNSALGAYYSNEVESIKANAANRIREGNNRVVGVVNQRNAEMTALQRWRQSVANSRVYEAVAANQEAMAINFNRARDMRTRAGFAANIRNAEESGRQQAAAAASGVSGSVVDVVNMTTRLKQGIERQAVKQTEGQLSYDFERKQEQARLATLDSLDFSLIFDNVQQVDYAINAPKRVDIFGAAISGKNTLRDLTQGAANFFKQPDPIGDFYLRGNTGAGD